MGLHSWQGAVGDGVARPSALGCALFIEEEDIMKYRKASPSERRAVAAEFLAGTTGIGFVENVAKKYFQWEVIWITIIIMGLLGLLFDITLRKIIDKTIPWRGKG